MADMLIGSPRRLWSPAVVAVVALVVGVLVGALLVQLGGCSYSPDGGGGVDAVAVDAAQPDAANVDAAARDASADAGADAAGTLTIDDVCAPLAEQCDPAPAPPLWPLGLTCRIRAANDGRCRPIGSTVEGGRCGAEDDCGANMTCLDDGTGVALRCFVVCDTLNPGARCRPDQVCTPLVGPAGVCQ